MCYRIHCILAVTAKQGRYLGQNRQPRLTILARADPILPPGADERPTANTLLVS